MLYLKTLALMLVLVTIPIALIKLVAVLWMWSPLAGAVVGLTIIAGAMVWASSQPPGPPIDSPRFPPVAMSVNLKHEDEP